jgi:hypothetical protein
VQQARIPPAKPLLGQRSVRRCPALLPSALTVGEGQALGSERLAEQPDGLGADAVQPQQLGQTYPDMPWEPKAAFRALAACYGNQPLP